MVWTQCKGWWWKCKMINLKVLSFTSTCWEHLLDWCIRAYRLASSASPLKKILSFSRRWAISALSHLPEGRFCWSKQKQKIKNPIRQTTTQTVRPLGSQVISVVKDDSRSLDGEGGSRSCWGVEVGALVWFLHQAYNCSSVCEQTHHHRCSRPQAVIYPAASLHVSEETRRVDFCVVNFIQ